MSEMNKVEVSARFVNIFTMQVCAEDDASDEEILEVCNRENVAGTRSGWTSVIRESDGTLGREENKSPVPCDSHPGRTHFLVLC